jgi:hypothetical protein
MTARKINAMGMELDEWRNKSCIAHFGTGKDWATLYDIVSGEPSKGHATELLLEAKRYYEKQGKKVAGDVALNDRMHNLYKKVGYTEYS